MEIKELLLKECSELELLEELLERTKSNKLVVGYSVNKSDDKKLMISMKGKNDKDALFLCFDKGTMIGLMRITDFETQMKTNIITENKEY